MSYSFSIPSWLWPLPYLVKGIVSFRFADDISVGDEVLVETNNKLTPVKVIDVSTLVMEGELNVF